MCVKLSQKLIAILKIKIFTVDARKFYAYFLRLPYNKSERKSTRRLYAHDQARMEERL